MLGKAVDLAVYTATGQEVVRKSLPYAVDRFTIPVPNIALGAYVLSVKSGSEKRALRFVVVR